ncbi:type II toxin-antitoxin system VapC family toxin [Rathayibacter soli]|uniref:type II toxin-antitoxin system VapC family toxin n=1 Tax=Rathayibacter soli TaxID=3144168 RepID=UPI0027E5359C|nr:type II toxin-antitoxin system VapC family toxin [Glaciibacter superstes]
MSVFADSSAIVKLYADEKGCEVIRELEAMLVSQLCRVEVPAALWRKNRMLALTAQNARVLVRAFENDLFNTDGPLVPVRVTSAILDVAASLAASHGLRAYDAIQLASALAARELDPACLIMAAFDHELRDAAAREGFQLLPESTLP